MPSYCFGLGGSFDSKIVQNLDKNRPKIEVWRRLEASWGRPGASWGVLRASSGGRGRFCVVLEGSWGRLGLSWERLGVVLGASWGRLGTSRDRLGSVLGASWAVFEATLLASNNFFEARHLGNHFSIGL